MKSKDTQLLEEAYNAVQKTAFRWIEDDPGVEISNRTYNIRGQDVLLKREKDRDEDSVWFYYSFIDPDTKERLFKDMSEEEIFALVKQQ